MLPATTDIYCLRQVVKEKVMVFQIFATVPLNFRFLMAFHTVEIESNNLLDIFIALSCYVNGPYFKYSVMKNHGYGV